jgi:hypothetical protein
MLRIKAALDQLKIGASLGRAASVATRQHSLNDRATILALALALIEKLRASEAIAVIGPAPALTSTAVVDVPLHGDR